MSQPDRQTPPAAIRPRSYWPTRGKPAEWFLFSWWVGLDRMQSLGGTPAEAIRNCYRIRRGRWLRQQDPGYMTTREQYRWTRLARRLA